MGTRYVHMQYGGGLNNSVAHVHSRLTGSGAIDDDVLQQMSLDIRSIVTYLTERGANSILVLGPLPRPSGSGRNRGIVDGI